MDNFGAYTNVNVGKRRDFYFLRENVSCIVLSFISSWDTNEMSPRSVIPNLRNSLHNKLKFKKDLERQIKYVLKKGKR